MTPLMRARRWRWTAPLAVAGLIATASLASSTAASAAGRPSLPARTAAELLVAMQAAHVPGLSGTVVQTTDLGLPSLPSHAPGVDVALGWQTFITGTHTALVWEAGPDRQRVALLGALAETDVVHDGQDVWTYTSQANVVEHHTLPAKTAGHPEATADTTPQLTPQQAADRALRMIDPTTVVTVDRTARVARRPVYQLILAPRDARSLVGRIVIAIDSATALPLRVRVFARGATKPALEVGFTSISFRTPRDSVFRFVPPAGSTVRDRAPQGGRGMADHAQKPAASGGIADQGTGKATVQLTITPKPPRVLGKGWTAVVDAPAMSFGGDAGALIYAASKPVAAGRLITTPLLTVLFTREGRVFAGAVSPAALEGVAATGRGL